MKMIQKSTGMAALITAGVAVAGLMSQSALAEPARKATKSASAVQSDLERRLQMMEEEMRALRSELNRSRSETKANAEKIEAHQQKVEEQLAESEAHEKAHHNLLFFRGGFAKMEHARNNELLLNNNRFADLGLSGTSEPKDGEGWYVGAGLDFNLTDNVWGLMDDTEVDGELMFEYKNFGNSHNTLVDAASNDIADKALGLQDGQLPAGTVKIRNQLTQFTLAASPKIKFNQFGAFRPWIIPVGLALHVISPPSSGVTVLNPGLMLGTGFEYNIWGDIWAGADFRYHFTGDDLGYKAKVPGVGTVYNKTDTDGFTTGAYIGIGF